MVDRIQMILQTKDLTPGKFADEIGVQRSSVSHILSGRNGPSLDFIQKILRKYPDISAAWLVSGDGQMYPGDSGVLQNEIKESRSGIPDLFSEPEESKTSEALVEEVDMRKKADEMESNLVDGNKAEPISGEDPTSKRKPHVVHIPNQTGNKVIQILFIYDDGTFSMLNPR